MNTIDDIKRLIGNDCMQPAINAASTLLRSDHITTHERATLLFLCGNAYRKMGNWRMAMNSYLEAMHLDPDGPAAMAYNNAQEIFNFYHKDLYNP